MTMPTKEQLENREEGLLKSFTPEELRNPITRQSLDDALRNVRAFRSQHVGA